MAASKPRVKVPKTASAGEIIEVKTLISHKMESGQRKDKDGNLIPRQIINKFVATFNGEEVFTVNLEAAVSANPYIEFSMKVPATGDLHFAWTDDDGSVYEETKTIKVA
ncbi:MAG: sulfur-oxidizing protein SoxZ [Paracoccaceae bacterium]|jgi:sulfur-oxidizing protein SoxZ